MNPCKCRVLHWLGMSPSNGLPVMSCMLAHNMSPSNGLPVMSCMLAHNMSPSNGLPVMSCMLAHNTSPSNGLGGHVLHAGLLHDVLVNNFHYQALLYCHTSEFVCAIVL